MMLIAAVTMLFKLSKVLDPARCSADDVLWMLALVALDGANFG